MITAAFVFLSRTGAVYAGDQNVTQAGNILQWVLPGIAVGSTFLTGNPDAYRWDREGTKEAILSIGTTAGIVYIGKEASRKLRPDGSDHNSFPSGHTSAAFSGASFIGTRYGWQWGAPAFAAAAFVGYSRFQGSQHYADDIIAGMSIALLSNWAWVKPKEDRENRVALVPVPLDRGIGLQLTLLEGDPAGKSAAATVLEPVSYPRYRFNFNFGPSWLIQNKVTSAAGSTFDLRTLQKDDNPLTTAAVQFDVALNERHELGFSIWPMESKDNGASTAPIVFQGVTFPGDTRLKSTWRLYDLRVRYRYEFFPKSSFIFAAGGGLMLQHHYLKLESADRTLKGEEDDTNVLPYAHLKLGWRFTEKVSVYINGDSGWIPGNWFADGGAYVNYRFRRNWDFTAGYQYFSRDIDPEGMRNKVIQHLPYLAVAYNW